MKETLNIVWLKRDLRLQDHLPFFEVENNTKCNYLPIYIFEPSAMSYPDCSLRHLQFVYHSILEMNTVLAAFNRKVHILHGEALDIFNFLIEILLIIYLSDFATSNKFKFSAKHFFEKF